MHTQVFVCPKCRASCIAEDWNAQKGKCTYCCTNKYHARKVEVDNHIFDSQHEANEYCKLCWQRDQGIIRDLELQVVYRLQINGQLICKYIADFRYVLATTGEVVVVDAKGYRTAIYKLKKRLMKVLLTINIVEV